jgi:hypothetical protein
MSSFTKDEFDCHILDEGFTAKDILDQKINEVSSSVSTGSPRKAATLLRAPSTIHEPVLPENLECDCGLSSGWSCHVSDC